MACLNHESTIQDLRQTPLIGGRIISFDLKPKKSISINFFVSPANNISKKGQEFIVIFTGLNSIEIENIDLDECIDNIVSFYKEDEEMIACNIILSSGEMSIVAKQCHVIQM